MSPLFYAAGVSGTLRRKVTTKKWIIQIFRLKYVNRVDIFLIF